MNTPVTVTYADDIIQAHMMIGVLEANSIKSYQDHGTINTLLPYLSKGVTVMVLEPDFDLAREVIEREFPGY